MPNKLSQFWQELKRRNVIRVFTVYAGAAFVIIELINNVTEPLRLPEWTPTLVIVLLAIGFPIVIIFSWIYDVHPDKGMVKTAPADMGHAEDIPTSSSSWKIASYISFVVIVGLVVLNIIPRSDKSESLEKSIAVLPFRNDSTEPENEYFINGTMESILDNLCKIENIRVIARTSVEQYRNKPMNVSEIARELNVSYILEGSGQRVGNQIRLTVQLIDAIHDDHIWSRQYDREVKDIFFIQSEIAKSIASEIRATVTPEVRNRIESEPTKNLQAYNLYLQGRDCLRGPYSREAIDCSIEFYKQALDLDPDFALAYSALAASYSAYAHGEILPRSEVMMLARDAALKALEIDPTLGEAHAELAWTRIYQDFEWEEGEKGLRAALQMNPNYAVGRQKYSWLLTFLERFDEAIEQAKYAIELDPLQEGYREWLGRAYLYADRYDDAIKEMRGFLRNYPHNDGCRRWLSVTYLQKGMLQEAREVFSEVKTKGTYWLDGYIYGKIGERDKVKEVLAYHLEQSGVRFIKPTDFTVIYAALGDHERALDYLEQAYQEREGWLVLLQVEPLYDDLRDEPRFQAIQEKMNFPPIKKLSSSQVP
jgi:TolB-like protein